MPKYLVALISLTLPALCGAIVFSTAGRWDLPFVWAVLGVLAAFSIALVYLSAPGLVRERTAPGPGNQDRLTRPLGTVMFVIHWTLVGLDVGRYHWSLVPWPVQTVAFVGYAAAMGFLLWAMCVNPFYSSTVRVQHDRGQHPIVNGPYRYVRHPGYAASILSFICGGIAFGSWLALLPILVFVGLFIRRTVVEDNLLQRELEGYAVYAQQVRYRLIVGIF